MFHIIKNYSKLIVIYHNIMYFRYIETVFRSQACINASFLLQNNSHYNCTYQKHGVDLDLAARSFGVISEIINNTITELVSYKVFHNTYLKLTLFRRSYLTKKVFVFKAEK